jgi:FMN phosphatase YigB (HAD superfamily)
MLRSTSSNGQFADTAAQCNCSPEHVRAVVQEWMEERPLHYLRPFRPPGVAELFDALRASGRTIAILSDYPAEEKLKVLGLKADLVVSAADEDVRCLKPETKGLQKILDLTHCAPANAIMIGDRFERDRAVADRLGMSAAILSRNQDSRCVTFQSYRSRLFHEVIGKAGGPKIELAFGD